MRLRILSYSRNTITPLPILVKVSVRDRRINGPGHVASARSGHMAWHSPLDIVIVGTGRLAKAREPERNSDDCG